MDKKIDKASVFNKEEKATSHPIRCYAYFADSKAFGLRVNNVLSCNLKVSFDRDNAQISLY